MKLDHKALEKISHEHIFVSNNGHSLKAVFDFELNRILYHVIKEGNHIIEIFENLETAVELFNELMVDGELPFID